MDKSGPATELTKRELFAALAMQAFINKGCGSDTSAINSVFYADALFKELNREAEKIPF